MYVSVIDRPINIHIWLQAIALRSHLDDYVTWQGIWRYIFFFLEVQVYMIKCNHYKPSLCAQSSVMEDEWKRDEQTNKTNKQTKQEQSTGKRSVGRMDDEGCRTWWCIDSWHGRSRFHENANFSMPMPICHLEIQGHLLCLGASASMSKSRWQLHVVKGKRHMMIIMMHPSKQT